MIFQKQSEKERMYFIVLLVPQTTKEGLRTKFGLMLGMGSVIQRIIFRSSLAWQ